MIRTQLSYSSSRPAHNSHHATNPKKKKGDPIHCTFIIGKPAAVGWRAARHVHLQEKRQTSYGDAHSGGTSEQPVIAAAADNGRQKILPHLLLLPPQQAAQSQHLFEIKLGQWLPHRALPRCLATRPPDWRRAPSHPVGAKKPKDFQPKLHVMAAMRRQRPARRLRENENRYSQCQQDRTTMPRILHANHRLAVPQKPSP